MLRFSVRLSQIRKSMATEGAEVFVCCMLDEVSFGLGCTSGIVVIVVNRYLVAT